MTSRLARLPGNAPSLLTRVAIAMIAIIVLVFGVHAIYSYSMQRAELIEGIRQDTSESLKRLSKNIAPFMESYSVNEYEKLVATETALKQHFAVIVKDARMGNVMGKPHYVSGQVQTDAGNYIPYQDGDSQLKERIRQAYYSDTAPIMSYRGQVIGQVAVYASDEILVARLQHILLEDILTSLLLALILSLLLVSVLRRYCVRSLKHMDFVMKNRDSEGIPLQPLPEFQYRELSSLSETINTMLGSIRASRERRALESLRLQNVINGTRTGTWEWNIRTGETVCNERSAEIVGYSLQELAPVSIKTWLQLVHPDDLQHCEALLKAHFRGESSFFECETRMKHKEGHWVWVLERGKVTSRAEGGRPLMMYGTHQDITQRKEAEGKLSMAAGVFRYAREGIIITSAEGRILDVNAAFTSLTGYRHDEAVNQHYTFLKSERHPPDFFRKVLQALEEEGVWTGEYWIACEDGTVVPSLTTIAAVRGGGGEVQHYVTLFADISVLKKNEAELRTIAHYDGLTGLPNRVLLNDRLTQLVSQARRHDNTLAIVFLDLDGFKQVNDTYGHDAGDELLIALAQRMLLTLRECDTVARIGGDEFVALLPELSQASDCKRVLDRLVTALATPVPIGHHMVQVSASLGVTFYPQDPDVDTDRLLRQADMAMYQAKQGGKNQYRFFRGLSGPARSSQEVPLPDNEAEGR